MTIVTALPLTPRSQDVLRLAEEEARLLGHTWVGTEHILLAIIRENEGIAAAVLASMRVDPGNVRKAIEFICPPVREP